MTDITSLAKRIRSKAEKATPGPWQQAHRKVYDTIHNEEWYRTEVFTSDGEPIAALAWYPKDEGNGVTGTYREDNAEYIALLHPDNVRALCDALAQRDAQIAALTAENVALKESVDHAAGCIHAAEAEGLVDALSSTTDWRLADLVHRRLCHAYLAVKTPATDAAANALRAEGAIAARNALVAAENGADIYATVTAVIDQLREGKA